LRHDYFACKNHVTPVKADINNNNCQQDSFVGYCTYVHTNKHRGIYRLKCTTRYLSGGPKKYDGGNVFRFMKPEELMAGDDSKLEEMCSELAGTHFTLEKIKFR
jgi:hypothetical protein